MGVMSRAGASMGVVLLLAMGLQCDSAPAPSSGSASTAANRNNLVAMETATLTINGHRFSAWVARTPKERELGLMQVTEQELSPLPDGTERGMLFVFEMEQPLQFWMANTIAPLDIAYIRTDGQIVKTYTMAPLDTRLYPSVLPARMALEANAGVFGRLGIAAGDVVQIPESVLKPSKP